jgi:hypothetical protein
MSGEMHAEFFIFRDRTSRQGDARLNKKWLRWSIVIPLLAFTAVCSGAPDKEEDTVAASLIPFESLSATNQIIVRGVTDHYTLRRQFSAQRFAGRKEQFEFLMNDMEACSALAQKLGLITYRATRETDGRVRANDNDGADGFLTNVLTNNTKFIYYVEGSQRGMFHVLGRGVAVVDYHAVEPNLIEYTGALFVKVDNRVLAALAQMFSVFVRGTVDKQFHQVMRQPIKLSEAAIADSQRLLEEIKAMPEADRRLLKSFAEMLASTNTTLKAERGR